MELKLTVTETNNIFASHAWLLHEIDNQHATYLDINEASLSVSPFLDHRVVTPPEAKKYKADISAVLGSEAWKTARPAHPTRYILHISHVGSTLVSRAVGIAPTCLALREPLPLRYLALKYQELGLPESWLSRQRFMQLADFTLRSLGRPLNARTDVVVKCTSWVNGLASLFLDRQFGGRKQVLAVCSTLNNFVANTLKSNGGRSDLESAAQSRVRRLCAMLPGVEIRLHALNSGEIAAMSWLCEMLSIYQACTQHGSDLCWLDFDAYLTDPLEGSAGLARHLGLEWSESFTVALADSGVLRNYSKSSNAMAFSADDRRAILHKYQNEQPEQIAAANAWLNTRFEQCPELQVAIGSFR
jgi:hypothetical protein